MLAHPPSRKAPQEENETPTERGTGAFLNSASAATRGCGFGMQRHRSDTASRRALGHGCWPAGSERDRGTAAACERKQPFTDFIFFFKGSRWALRAVLPTPSRSPSAESRRLVKARLRRRLPSAGPQPRRVTGPGSRLGRGAGRPLPSGPRVSLRRSRFCSLGAWLAWGGGRAYRPRGEAFAGARPSPAPGWGRREQITKGRVPFKHLPPRPFPRGAGQGRGCRGASLPLLSWCRGAARGVGRECWGPPSRPIGAAAIFSVQRPRRRLPGPRHLPAGAGEARWAPSWASAALSLFLECPLCPAGGMPRCGAGLGREEEPLSRRSCHVGGAKRIWVREKMAAGNRPAPFPPRRDLTLPADDPRPFFFCAVFSLFRRRWPAACLLPPCPERTCASLPAPPYSGRRPFPLGGNTSRGKEE